MKKISTIIANQCSHIQLAYTIKPPLYWWFSLTIQDIIIMFKVGYPVMNNLLLHESCHDYNYV